MDVYKICQLYRFFYQILSQKAQLYLASGDVALAKMAVKDLEVGHRGNFVRQGK